jgi:hypothetical protein
MNEDNLNNVKPVPSRYLRNKGRDYLKNRKKLMNLNQTVRIRISEIYIGA